MGKLVVTEFVSIDGVFEDPGGAENYEHGGWTFEYNRGEDGDRFKVDKLMEADVQLLGRTDLRRLRGGVAFPRRGLSPTRSTTARSTWSRARSRIRSGRTQR